MRRTFWLMLLAAAPAVTAAGAAPDLHFEPQGLYGYINGGSELFLEFGFEGLDVYRHRLADAPADDPDAGRLDVEVYRMTDAVAALGIYLAKCGQEQPWDGVHARCTGSDYQLTAVRGTLFVQVNNFAGDAAARPEMVRLANGVLEREDRAAPLPIWNRLPVEGRVPGSEFLFRGRFALDPIYTFGPGDALQVEQGALGVGARYTLPSGAVIKRLVVVYPGPDAAAAALAHLQTHLDPYLTVERRDAGELVFRDWEGQHGRVRLVGGRLEIALHLPEVPPGS